MEAVLKLIVGLLFCSVKFGVMFLPTIRINGYNFFESLLFGMAAGFLGNIIFVYAGDYLSRLIDKIIASVRGNRPKKIKKKFTKSSRRLVKIKSKYGLFGIALLSPLVISIPVGAFLAVRYYHNKKKIMLYMMASVAAWTLLFSSANLLF